MTAAAVTQARSVPQVAAPAVPSHVIEPKIAIASSWSGGLQPAVAGSVNSRRAEARRSTTMERETVESLVAAAMSSADFSSFSSSSSLPLVTAEASDSAAPHDFFEELADRLEQAAAEMGLGED